MTIVTIMTIMTIMTIQPMALYGGGNDGNTCKRSGIVLNLFFFLDDPKSKLRLNVV